MPSAEILSPRTRPYRLITATFTHIKNLRYGGVMKVVYEKCAVRHFGRREKKKMSMDNIDT